MSQTSGAASYSKFVSCEMSKAEALLKFCSYCPFISKKHLMCKNYLVPSDASLCECQSLGYTLQLILKQILTVLCYLRAHPWNFNEYWSLRLLVLPTLLRHRKP